MNSEDGQVYTVWILQFSCFTKYNSMQSKHKQTKCKHVKCNSFLSTYHYTKSKNYLKRRYRICHWIPMFFGTPCIKFCLQSLFILKVTWKGETVYRSIYVYIIHETVYHFYRSIYVYIIHETVYHFYRSIYA